MGKLCFFGGDPEKTSRVTCLEESIKEEEKNLEDIEGEIDSLEDDRGICESTIIRFKNETKRLLDGSIPDASEEDREKLENWSRVMSSV